MAYYAAATKKGRLRQLLGWAFWWSMIREAVREILFGPKPKRMGQWVYHPHRQTWEWRESPTVWVPDSYHP